MFYICIDISNHWITIQLISNTSNYISNTNYASDNYWYQYSFRPSLMYLANLNSFLPLLLNSSASLAIFGSDVQYGDIYFVLNSSNIGFWQSRMKCSSSPLSILLHLLHILSCLGLQLPAYLPTSIGNLWLQVLILDMAMRK